GAAAGAPSWAATRGGGASPRGGTPPPGAPGPPVSPVSPARESGTRPCPSRPSTVPPIARTDGSAPPPRAARHRAAGHDLGGQQRNRLGASDLAQHHEADVSVPTLLIDTQRREISPSRQSGRLGRETRSLEERLDAIRGPAGGIAQRLGATRR